MMLLMTHRDIDRQAGRQADERTDGWMDGETSRIRTGVERTLNAINEIIITSLFCETRTEEINLHCMALESSRVSGCSPVD